MKKYWLAVNQDQFSLCETPFEHVPRVIPKPVALLGFPTLQEAQDAIVILKYIETIYDLIFILKMVARHTSSVTLILNPDYEITDIEPNQWQWEATE